MVFKSEPNLYVKLSNKYVQRSTGLKGFSFDSNGEYETENDLMIKVLSQNFEVKEEIKEKLIERENEQVETVSFKCKKCEFETDNNGKLLAHYRKEHPKEG